MFSQIIEKLKEMLQGMLGINKRNLEETLHITSAVSNVMADAISEWTDMYEDKAPWIRANPSVKNPEMIVSLGLPAFIASEKARMATLELKSEITAPKESKEEKNPEYFPPKIDQQTGQIQASGKEPTVIVEETKGPEERAKYLNEQYHEKLLSKIRTQLEFGIAKGSLIIKPYVIKKQVASVPGVENDVEDIYDIDFDFIQADCFYPFAFDSSGNLSEVAFIQTKTDKDILYTRLEYHKLEGNKVTILNKAFKQMNGGQQVTSSSVKASLGQEIPLSAVYEWKDLVPKAEIKFVDRLLFGYFKMPEANTIDPHSPLGISGFARAKMLIREADKQYSRLLWEYEGGELAIDIDQDALKPRKDADGNEHYRNPILQQRLFRNVDVRIDGETYNPYNPILRDNSYINGLNNILMRIEDVCAMSRGTIAEVTVEARTATELKILRQRSYSSNLDIQKALEKALRDAIYTMDVYCTLYNIVGDTPKDANGNTDVSKKGNFDVSFEWDDSILVDEDVELTRRLTLMEKGIASKVETRMWYYGETEKQAREALSKVSEESMRAIEQNAVASSMLGKNMQSQNEQQTENGNENTSENSEPTKAKNKTQQKVLTK